MPFPPRSQRLGTVTQLFPSRKAPIAIAAAAIVMFLRNCVISTILVCSSSTVQKLCISTDVATRKAATRMPAMRGRMLSMMPSHPPRDLAQASGVYKHSPIRDKPAATKWREPEGAQDVCQVSALSLARCRPIC